MNLDEIHWEEPLAHEYLTELGGSKSGAYAYLDDTQPVLRPHLPSGTKYLAPEDNVEKFLDKIDYSKPKIVRGCHPLDVFGMVDVIPTQIDVRGREAVRQAVYDLLGWTRKNREARSFIEYESGQPFDGKVGILVQDFCGKVRGSIIQHPHERELYRIGHVAPAFIGDEIVDEDNCDGTGNVIEQFHFMRNKNDPKKFKKTPSHEKEITKRIIQLYRKIQESGLMPASHSFQMEFGQEDDTGEIKFYQARLFKPFQPMADFDLNDLDLEGKWSVTSPYNAFGITSPEGSEIMHRAELTKEFINRRKKERQVVYAHNAYEHRQTTPLDVQPRNIYGFLPYQHHCILEHGYYRWSQKAPVTLVGAGSQMPGVFWGSDKNPFYEPVQKINQTVRVKLFSNGFRGIIQFVE